MSQTTPPTVTALPPAPNTSSPSTFAAMADAFLSALVTFGTQLSALATNVYNNAVDAFNSAGLAAASAAAATSTANAAPWVSGASVAQFANVISVDGRTYRRFAATGSGTLDPSIDPANYVCVSAGAFPHLHVSNRTASGTNSGEAFSGAPTTFQRALNTTVANTISGASLASNNITLPAGTYDCLITAPTYNATAHKASLYDNTASATALVGTSEGSSTTAIGQTSTVRGRLTITSAHSFSVKHYMQASGGGGLIASSGLVEVFTEAQFWKVE